MVCIITVRANQILLKAKVRQRYSDDDVCFIYFIRAVGILPFSTEGFVLYVRLEWMTLDLFTVGASSGTLARSSRQLLFLLSVFLRVG